MIIRFLKKADKQIVFQYLYKYKSYFGLLIVLTSAVCVCLPLFRSSFIPTHDGEYHIIRLYEFEKSLKEGILFPRWAPGLNSGYGNPIFTYMYPLPNYLGVIFHALGLSLSDSFEISLAVSYISAVLLCYMWLYCLHANLFSSVLATIAMSLVPYWFLDIYIRGSIGEVMALGFVFASFFSIEKRKFTLLSLSLAGLILSHNISAILYVPIVIGYSTLRRYGVVACIVGILIGANFWVPAIFEQKYVTGLNTVNYLDHFPEIYELLIPSWGSGFSAGISSNKMSFQIGIIPFCILVFSFIYLRNNRRTGYAILSLYGCIIAVIGIFCMLPISKSLWKIIPILPYIQYPWRFLSYIILVTAIGGYHVFHYNHRKYFVGTVCIVLSYILVYSYIRPVEYFPRTDAYYLTKREFTDGTSSMGNAFATIYTGIKTERPTQILEILSGHAEKTQVNDSIQKKSWKIFSHGTTKARINIGYFPGWKAMLNRKEIPIDKTYGTLDIRIPPGKWTLEIELTKTPIQLLALIISFCSLSILILRSILFCIV